MKRIGSQIRETVEQAGYQFVRKLNSRSIVLAVGGRMELWVKNDHFAGYTVEFKGQGYEFIREYS
jgi:hypothetical protein